MDRRVGVSPYGQFEGKWILAQGVRLHYFGFVLREVTTPHGIYLHCHPLTELVQVSVSGGITRKDDPFQSSVECPATLPTAGLISVSEAPKAWVT